MANKVISQAQKDKNAKIAILVVTIILSVLFIVLGAVLPGSSSSNHDSPASSNSSNSGNTIAGKINTGSNSITISGSNKYYEFTPTTSGTYRFYSTGNYDPAAILYNSNWSQLSSDDDSGTSNNFSISQRLTSGTKYYLAVRLVGSSSNSTSITVYVERSSN